ESVSNPLPASGGVEPESSEDVRQRAPSAFRTQERAVTAEDYAAVVERRDDIQQAAATFRWTRSEEHTSELQSRSDLVCRLLLEISTQPASSNLFPYTTLFRSRERLQPTAGQRRSRAREQRGCPPASAERLSNPGARRHRRGLRRSGRAARRHPAGRRHLPLDQIGRAHV